MLFRYIPSPLKEFTGPHYKFQWRAYFPLLVEDQENICDYLKQPKYEVYGFGITPPSSCEIGLVNFFFIKKNLWICRDSKSLIMLANWLQFRLREKPASLITIWMYSLMSHRLLVKDFALNLEFSSLPYGRNFQALVYAADKQVQVYLYTYVGAGSLTQPITQHLTQQ